MVRVPPVSYVGQMWRINWWGFDIANGWIFKSIVIFVHSISKECFDVKVDSVFDIRRD